MARSLLAVTCLAALVALSIQAPLAHADITIDPDSTGATDVAQMAPDETVTPISSPVVDPLDLGEDDLIVGNTADGVMSVTNGGYIIDANGWVGREVGSNGLITVDGSSSQWENLGRLRVGWLGAGEVIIQNGGRVSSIPVSGLYEVSSIGNGADAVGSITVDGTGSVWEDGSSRLDVGSDGVGTLTIQNGGSVIAAGPVIVDPDKTGSKIVFDTNSGTGSLTAQAVFASETSLEGIGTINADGWCFDSDVVIAQASDLQYDLHLNSLPGQDIHAIIDLTTGEGRLGIGFDNTASMTIQNGMTVRSNRGYIAYRTGSVGTATVTGAGTTWEDSSDYYQVGFKGDGTLIVENEGKVTSTGKGYIGQYAGSAGTITVAGSGSQFSLTADYFIVGSDGDATLNIQDGGTVVSSDWVAVGYAEGSSGTVTVDGTGSTWTINDQFQMGRNGTAFLTISGGGTVTSAGDGSWLGLGDVSTEARSEVTVDGAGSTWSAGSELIVGDAANGTLTIRDGGRVTVTGDAVIANALTSHGTLAIGIGDNGPGKLTATGDFYIEEGVSTLQVTVDTATIPTVGQLYKVIEFAAISPDSTNTAFTNEPGPTLTDEYILDWNVQYNTSDITLEVATSTLVGDFDENGTVESADLTAWQSGFGTTADAVHTNGDSDLDGDVDGADFLTWQGQYGMSAGTAAMSTQAIPEPGTIALAFALLLGVVGCRWVKRIV